tara:strand:- start:552 stop:3431 length:2880 start_codon:yes stop_codon:yes gene_type:complete
MHGLLVLRWIAAWFLLAPILVMGVPGNPQEAPSWTRGEHLVTEHQCVACHAGPANTVLSRYSKTAPRLQGVGQRIAPDYLRRFLADPAGTRAGTTMPHLLANAEHLERDVDLLVHFLATLGGTFDAQPHGSVNAEVEQGRALFHSVGCVACHLPEEELWELELPWREVVRLRAEATDEAQDVDGAADAPYVLPGVLDPLDLPLDHIAGKTNTTQLAAFLADPLHVRPSGRMPSLSLTSKEADAIAAYLLRSQIDPESLATSPGLLAERLESAMPYDPDFASLEPVDTIVVDTIGIDERRRDDDFGFRFTGQVDVPTDGTWTWFAHSDDGSRIWIDGELVVDNWFHHAPGEASGSKDVRAGLHGIEVHYFEASGGEELLVEWAGPGHERGPIAADRLSHLGLRCQPPTSTFVADPVKAVRGGHLFASLGCTSCHETGWGEHEILPAHSSGAPALLETPQAAGHACLGGAEEGSSRFDFDAAQRADVHAFLKSDAVHQDLHAPGALDRHLQRMGCVHCHRRDDFGGVHPLNRDYFRAALGADLGDEGRIPPDLTGVGGKLRRSTLDEVLLRGDPVRPYMTTRMPMFGEASMSELADVFDATDPDFAFDRILPPTGETLRHAGRLVGTKGGLGCIQCHDFAGTPSLGIRAVDLARMYERLEPGWFRAMLLDPRSVSTGTRMVQLWDEGLSPVLDVYDGDPLRQIDAIWHLLSLGQDMPRPIGLEADDAAFELIPRQGALSCGVFMQDLSPRTVVVGFPELVHYAYDVEHGRLGKVWRGRFFNASGTWKGRAGQLQIPPSAEAYEPPRGMPLATFPDGSKVQAWPSAVGKAAGFSAWRRTFADDDTPTFWSDWDERVVAETLTPREGGDRMVRTFEVWSADADEAIWLRVDPAWSGTLHGSDGDVFSFGGEAGYPLEAHPTRILEHKTRDGQVEYRVRLASQPGVAPKPGLDNVYRVTLELNW